MPLAIIIKDFKFAHFGYQVEEFTASDEIKDLPEECFEIAEREGWVRVPTEGELFREICGADACTEAEPAAEVADVDPEAAPEPDSKKPTKRAAAKE